MSIVDWQIQGPATGTATKHLLPSKETAQNPWPVEVSNPLPMGWIIEQIGKAVSGVLLSRFNEGGNHREYAHYLMLKQKQQFRDRG